MLEMSRFIAVKLQNVLADKKGVTVLEYGVLGALILVVAVGGMVGIGPKITAAFTSITGALP
jgi:pilus assembly protein Flp/PilA